MYSEREGNPIIADFYADFGIIRYDMVRERLFGRNGAEYWRIKND